MTVTPTPGERRPREEDYRDYESRDVDAGWPYADTPRDPGENPDYGRERADTDENAGFRVTGIDSAGNEADLRDNALPATDGRDISDDLEERINDRLSLLEDVALDAIDVHADGNVVTITGSVDDMAQMRRVEIAVAGVSGVAHVRNELRTLGADSHMPDDD
ncbi:BON domain-containing protein [Rhizobium sp. YJ-22]|uniref:BON domain-containing protein n=1 Tax=Rhizobium sp. YJ-22 TaxID=3037556 RepID=UPI002412D474|nr:BON domain-containing protein [Rhizobium sp. YJ-22]MDG3578714.1 BON domain-containing protein [Rhizobium sp. YJ-22]